LRFYAHLLLRLQNISCVISIEVDLSSAYYYRSYLEYLYYYLAKYSIGQY